MKQQRSFPIATIVVPCRGHARQLASCLRGLEQQVSTSPYEIIVVDSAADPAVATVVGRFPMVFLVRSQLGLLPSAARNLGVSQARGRYLAFTDADCVPEPQWLQSAIEALRAGAKVVGGPVLDALPFHPIAVADNLLQFADFPQKRPDGAASYFPGCNVALGRDEFHQLGGFPHTTLQAGEDTLFCEAATARWPDGIRFVQGMRVRHTGRTNFIAFWKHQESFGFCRGALGLKLRTLYKNLGKWSVMTTPVACKRLSYIVFRTMQWHPVGLVRIILLLPVLLIGLAAWARGFRRGCLVSGKQTA